MLRKNLCMLMAAVVMTFSWVGETPEVAQAAWLQSAMLARSSLRVRPRRTSSLGR